MKAKDSDKVLLFDSRLCVEIISEKVLLTEAKRTTQIRIVTTICCSVASLRQVVRGVRDGELSFEDCSALSATHSGVRVARTVTGKVFVTIGGTGHRLGKRYVQRQVESATQDWVVLLFTVLIVFATRHNVGGNTQKMRHVFIIVLVPH